MRFSIVALEPKSESNATAVVWTKMRLRSVMFLVSRIYMGRKLPFDLLNII